MKTNIAIDISPSIPNLGKFCFSSYWPKYSQPVSLKCDVSRKKLMMKFIFGMPGIFIQTILMSVIVYKKLSLTVE